ncbi:hypothetical protein [Mannheimia indoligenes]|uniref:hypothetical protein n=1 Tax=Mannheimia indoligenes TaxID=3103145 RepID=UPI002FE542F1
MGLNKKKLTKAEEMKLVFSDFVEMRGNPKSKDRTFFVIKSDKKIKAFTPVFRYSPKTGRITDETEWINQKMMNSFDVFGFGYNYRDVCTLLKRWKQTLPKLNMDFEDSEIECVVNNKSC